MNRLPNNVTAVPGSFPSSALPGLLTAYREKLAQLAKNADAHPPLDGVAVEAEAAALQRLMCKTEVLEFMSCCNSPFFSPREAMCTKEQKMRYTEMILRTITAPTYNRYLKVVMLLLRELRFLVFVRDAQLFSRLFAPLPKPQHSAAQPAAGSPQWTPPLWSTSQPDTVQKVIDAFQAIAARRYYSAGQLLMQRSALGQNKTARFAVALTAAATQLKTALAVFSTCHLVLRDAARLGALARVWESATPPVEAQAELAKVTTTAADACAYLLQLQERLRHIGAAHAESTRGSDVGRICGATSQKAGFYRTALSRQRVVPFSSPKVEAPVMLSFLRSGGAPDAVELALGNFIAVAESVAVLAPELCAMNFLLRLYGLDDAEHYAHEVDVIDGTFKRVIGDVFENESLEQQQTRVAQQVLIPHCRQVTGCDEATARAWVLACLRASLPKQTRSSSSSNGNDKGGGAGALESNETPAELPADGMPVWTGDSTSATATSGSRPPQYRMVRSVHYRWNEAGRAQLPCLQGELDGVVYDAATRQVLFVLEAKHNIADIGKACKQKTRLYSSLDMVWKARSQPPPAPSQSPPTTKAKGEDITTTTTNITAAGVSGNAPGATVELQFWVAAEGPAVPTAVASGNEEEEKKEDTEKEGEEVGPDAATADAPSPAAAKAMALCFTQDNFTEFFTCGPPPAAAAVHADPDRTGDAAAVDVARERRWVYLTSLRVDSIGEADSSAPAPGGEIYLVEAALVTAVGEVVGNAYQTYSRTGRLPAGPNGELKALFAELEKCSFYTACVQKKRGDAGMAAVPWFNLKLHFPQPSALAAPAGPLPDASVSPYAYALQLWRDGVMMADDTPAIKHVKMTSGFLNELHLGDRQLNFAVDSVAKRVGKGSKTTPSFCAVLKALMDLHCTRNLVVMTNDADEAC